MNLHAHLVALNKNWRCLSGQTFFGLTDEYMENVYEQFFILKHYGSWSLIELYNLPVGLRDWWLNRTLKEFEKKKKEQEKASNKSRR